MCTKFSTGVAAVVLGLAAVAAGGAAEAAPARWSGNGHLYQTVHVPDGIYWTQANAAARRLGCGWHLATLTSAAENRFVYSLVARQPDLFQGSFGPWIGGRQAKGAKEPAGGWGWVTGERFAYTNWKAGEPSNTDGDEAYLHLWRGGTWNDAPNYRFEKGYVAEQDHPCGGAAAAARP